VGAAGREIGVELTEHFGGSENVPLGAQDLPESCAGNAATSPVPTQY